MTHAELIAALKAAKEPSMALDFSIAAELEKSALPFTSSIDAAITLVPPKYEWCIYGAGGADVWKPDGLRRHEMTYAATPAIAICIAALSIPKEPAP